ncbi:MAG: hypothetical protein HC837_04790 [Chloroflexaceae bacterium]|nr:hypothetical protein [Chloroflexaceae bacterium]
MKYRRTEPSHCQPAPPPLLHGLLVLLLIADCAAVADQPAPPEPPAASESTAATGLADVISVEVSGEPNAYRFAVGIASADSGCEQYANWCPVLGSDGRLLYRRILLHSHVTEQPFVRSGGPVHIAADTLVWVRAHMHPQGLGGQALRGSVDTGFAPAELPADFAADVLEQPPKPDDCAF